MMFHIAGSVVRVDLRELRRILIEDVQEGKDVVGGFLCNFIVKKLCEYWGDELQLDGNDDRLHVRVEDAVIFTLRYGFGRTSITSGPVGIDSSFNPTENAEFLNLGLKLVGEVCVVDSYSACLNGAVCGAYTDMRQYVRATNRIGMIEVLLRSGVNGIQFLLN